MGRSIVSTPKNSITLRLKALLQNALIFIRAYLIFYFFSSLLFLIFKKNKHMEKNSNSYAHLDIELSDSFYTSYRKFQFFGKLMGSTSASRFGLRILAKVIPFKIFILASNIAGNYVYVVK